jgi:hypothetical protein
MSRRLTMTIARPMAMIRQDSTCPVELTDDRVSVGGGVTFGPDVAPRTSLVGLAP